MTLENIVPYENNILNQAVFKRPIQFDHVVIQNVGQRSFRADLIDNVLDDAGGRDPQTDEFLQILTSAGF